MLKLVLREGTITILCAIAMVLVIGIVFYDSAATNKVIPTDVSYKIPDNVQAELDEIAQVKNIEKMNIVYTIDDSDLDLYKKSQSYNPGKADPFSAYAEKTQEEEQNQKTVNEIEKKGYNVSEVKSANTTANSNTEGTFYESNSAK